MKPSSGVAIVGGGPCGSFTALNLAQHEVDVSVFEEHNEIGVPSHCAGHLSISGLKRLGLFPLPNGIVENTFRGAVFHSPNCKRFSVHFTSPVTCVVNRTSFDKHIARMAETAGAKYFLNSKVESLLIKDSFARGIVVKKEGKTEERFPAKIVIDTEGIFPKILRQTGLVEPNRQKFVNGAEAEVENADNLEKDIVEVFLGRKFAPDFYAWIIPKGSGRAGVGLGAKFGNPKRLLESFMLKHPIASKKLRSARIRQIAFHPLTLGGMIPKTYSDGFFAVGDCASQVKPTTGGGVILGLNCGKIAAEIAYEAVQKDDFSSNILRSYQKKCEKFLGFDLAVMLRARRFLDSMSDEKLDNIIGFCASMGLDKVLEKVEDVDFQGRTFLHSLRNPRVPVTFLYFLFSWLSANI